ALPPVARRTAHSREAGGRGAPIVDRSSARIPRASVTSVVADVASGTLLWAAGVGGALVLAGSVVAGSLLAAAERRREQRLARRQARATHYGFEVPEAGEAERVTAPPEPPVAAVEAAETAQIAEAAEPAQIAETAQIAEAAEAAPDVLEAPSPRPEPASVVELPEAAGEPPAPAGAAGGNLRGILRWLASDTDADAVALLEMRPGGRERMLVEPPGLPGPAIVDLARRVRDALLTAASGETALPTAAASRWLGAGGVKAILLVGVSPVSAAESLRFAR